MTDNRFLDIARKRRTQYALAATPARPGPGHQPHPGGDPASPSSFNSQARAPDPARRPEREVLGHREGRAAQDRAGRRLPHHRKEDRRLCRRRQHRPVLRGPGPVKALQEQFRSTPRTSRIWSEHGTGIAHTRCGWRWPKPASAPACSTTTRCRTQRWPRVEHPGQLGAARADAVGSHAGEIGKIHRRRERFVVAA